MNTVSTIFIGSSIEGISSLEALVAHPRFDITAVITQPAKPVGRKKELAKTPINETASNLELTIYTPQGGSDPLYEKIIVDHNPTVAVVIAFGQMIPKLFIDALPRGCLNVHYSLLPILRGAVPVQMSILQGLTQTGVTIQCMEESLDTGPILAQQSIPISSDDTTETLKEKLIPLGKDMLLDTLPEWINSKITPVPQDHKKATYCQTADLSKENAQIFWETHSPAIIERMIRAFVPKPVAWTFLPNGSRMKIFEGSLEHTDEPTSHPGEILKRTDCLYFVTNDSHTILKATSVQLEGKSVTSGQDFIKGYRHDRMKPS